MMSRYDAFRMPALPASGQLLDNIGRLYGIARNKCESDQNYRARIFDEQMRVLGFEGKRRAELLDEALEKAAPYRMRMEDFTLSAAEMERLQAPLRRCIIADEDMLPYSAAVPSTPVRWKELSADDICKEVRADCEELFGTKVQASRAKELGVDADWLWSQPVPASVTPPFVEGLRRALRQLDIARSMFFELQHANYYADPAVRQYCADMVTSIDAAKNKMIYGSQKDGE